MSFILDALRRAEQERRLGQTPSLQTVATTAVAPAARRRSVWLWLVLGVLAVGGVFWAYRWLHQIPFGGAQVAVPEAAIEPVSPEPDSALSPPLADRGLAQAMRQELADLSIDIHVYSEQPERRFVLLNGKRYRQGDRLREGPLLETITEQGVILVYRRQRFVLPVEP